ncbi:MAG TPA: PilZ domain-containing protein [Nitrospirota bacterium]|nr:PilZ domain-containing protein [Nitrospirota bacterium]
MDDRGKKSPPSGSEEEIAEKRREQRYTVPDACQEHIKLQVKSGNEFVPALLGNFSRNGILFESPVPFRQGEHTECIVSISFMPTREISFGIEVRYCYADHGSHITGAAVDTISDENWFDVFVDAHDFIVLRQCSR